MEITSNTAAWQPSHDPRVAGENTSSNGDVTRVDRRPAPVAKATGDGQPQTTSTAVAVPR